MTPTAAPKEPVKETPAQEIPVYAIAPKLRADLDEQFKYHRPFGTQQTRYEILRNKARDLAFTIASLTPPSADQNAALRKLRECIMTANAAIAINEKDPSELAGI